MYNAFMNLEKAYDEACREELWMLLDEFGVDGYLIRSMISLYDGSTACVRLGSRVGEYFEVRRQGCIEFLWLISIFFDRVVRQVNDRAMGSGVKLRDESEWVGKLNKYCMQMTKCL